MKTYSNGIRAKDGGDELLVNSSLVPIEMVGRMPDGQFNQGGAEWCFCKYKI